MLGKDNWPTPSTNPTRPNEGNVRIYRKKIHQGEMTVEEGAAMLNGKNPFTAQGKIPAIRGTTPAEWQKATLNPAWVCWLLNWPLGWDSLEPMPATSLADHAEKTADGSWWQDEPPIPRIDKNIPNRAARLKGLGNGMVPLCFVHAFNGLAYENI